MITLHTAQKPFQAFIESLPEQFDRKGRTVHQKRNTIKVFDEKAGKVAVKKFQRPSWLRAFIYTFIRKSKAQRSYEHACRLLELGIDTPAPVAWSEYRRKGVLCDSYYVSRYSDYQPLSEATNDIMNASSREVLDAFVRFAVRLHGLGIEHQDFNHGNVLWQRNADTGEIRFQLIDINRMRFHKGPLSPRRCMINLRRLSCSAVSFLYILDRYAEECNLDVDDTLLRGTFFRLAFERSKEIRKRFKQRFPRKS